MRSGCELQAQARHAGPSLLYMPQTPQLPRAAKLTAAAAAAAAVLHELSSVVVFVVHVCVVPHVVSYFARAGRSQASVELLSLYTACV